jgi:outer membrane protein OmpA-like peptidoglycan-associated protein
MIICILLKETEGFLVEGEVKDIKTKALLKGTEVSLFDNQNKLVGSVIVGDDAFYSFKTKPNEIYKITAKKDFYVYYQEELKTNDFGKIFKKLELDLESFEDAEELISAKKDKKLYINLENIYFDTNKWIVKPEAEKILDKLYAILVKHPFMEIELNAHTDFVGNDNANLKLSINRANAVSNYLIFKGISKQRLYSKGYGETKPLIQCGINCSKEENSINRRCEFIIIK